MSERHEARFARIRNGKISLSSFRIEAVINIFKFYFKRRDANKINIIMTV